LKTGEQLQVSIVGMDGKQKMVKITDKMQDQILVETTLFKAGVYICTISVGKKKVESTEFTVIH